MFSDSAFPTKKEFPHLQELYIFLGEVPTPAGTQLIFFLV